MDSNWKGNSELFHKRKAEVEIATKSVLKNKKNEFPLPVASHNVPICANCTGVPVGVVKDESVRESSLKALTITNTR